MQATSFDDVAGDLVRLLRATRRHATADLGPSVAWDRLFDLAARHGVAPLVAYGVRAGLVANVPSSAAGRAATIRRRNAVAARLADRRFEVIRRAFDARGIDVRVLKGNAVAAWAYPDVAARSVGDLDLLIRRRDLVAADAILRDLGHRTFVPRHIVAGRSGATFAESRRDIEYEAQSEGPPVELHWRWTRNPYVLPFDEAVMFDGPEDAVRAELFVFLCVHGGQHRWCLLKWLVDIDRLCSEVADPPLDWPLVRRRAVALGATAWVGLAVTLAARILGTKVPAPIDFPCAEGAVGPCLAEIAAPRASHRALNPTAFGELLRNIRACPTPFRAARLVLHDATCPTVRDLEVVDACGLDPRLAYATRPFNWAAKMARGLTWRGHEHPNR